MHVKLAAIAAILFLRIPASGEPLIDYARDVQPILSDKCYHCHGPDKEMREAHLRLDMKDDAFRPRKGRAVIVPGQPEKSELIKKIFSDDEYKMMPPPESHRVLTERQKRTLRTWIAQGAKWGGHWAYTTIVRPEVPAVKRGDWARNPVDDFVLARLEKEGLDPSPEADRYRLIRRVSLDLTGLPPTLAEVRAFVSDKSADAYEKLVDRLLASPQYGERMAADWLDIARYADTHGYQMDRYRAMWPYRDWVIKAFNENLSYDKFVTWQLAGDLLPHATKEQRLATAFNRLHMQNEEGGIVAEEFRVAYVVDRVNTFSTAFLGMTMQCSRCHDHKYDPITMRDYYSMFAFFQNIDESGQTSYFTSSMPVPTVLLSTDAQDAKLAELHTGIAAKEKALVAERQPARELFKQWRAGKPELAVPGCVASYSFDELDKGTIANAVNPKLPGHAQENPQLVAGASGKAAQLSGENGFTFPGVGHFSRVDPFSLAIRVWMPERTPRAVVVHHSKAPVDAGSRGYELLLEDGHVAFGLHHMWPGNSLKVRSRGEVPVGKWTHIAVTYDGSSRAAGVHIYINGRQSELEVVRDGLWKDITYGGGEPDLAIGYRFRDNGFKDGRVDDFAVYARALTGGEVRDIAGEGKLMDAGPDDLFDYYFATACAPAKRLREELHSLRKRQSDLINPIPEVMGMVELPKPKPAYILKRGAYDARGEQVSMDTPKFLPPFPPGAPRNRLGLAQWLLARNNPLLARVTVNRLWQQMFGEGIVSTPDNFGSQGSPPTHPHLLDWLAAEFMDSGWDVKHMLKVMAMSATYRQDSRVTPALVARDPGNALLARGPARRLTAEMLRDQALQDSGLLVEKIGGPSVKPYQPPGLWEEIAMGHPHYGQGHGDDLHRRSLYTFWKRTVPPPAMITFDASERNVCVVKRQDTSTPLQALVLLNDTQVVEASRLIAQRMVKDGGSTPEQRVAWAFELITGRPAQAREVQVLAEMYREQRALFASGQGNAGKLLAVGEVHNDSKLDKLDLATGTLVARAILNLDDAVMRR